MMVFHNPHHGVGPFLDLVCNHPDGSPLVCRLEGDCHPDLTRAHALSFGWHRVDSERSFTRTGGTLFSYRRRLVQHFDNQLDPPPPAGRVVSVWDPLVDNTQPRGMKPCLMNMVFTDDSGGVSHLSVVWRARDILRRMVPNWFWVIRLGREVLTRRGRTLGFIYDYSHRAFSNPGDLEVFTKHAETR